MAFTCQLCGTANWVPWCCKGRGRGKRPSEGTGITPSSTAEGEGCPSLWTSWVRRSECPHAAPTALPCTQLVLRPGGTGSPSFLPCAAWFPLLLAVPYPMLYHPPQCPAAYSSCLQKAQKGWSGLGNGGSVAANHERWWSPWWSPSQRVPNGTCKICQRPLLWWGGWGWICLKWREESRLCVLGIPSPMNGKEEWRN